MSTPVTKNEKGFTGDRSNVSEGEHDIRLDDYLNDKLQTATDFQNLDSLIANVEGQRVQLLSQVSHSTLKWVLLLD